MGRFWFKVFRRAVPPPLFNFSFLPGRNIIFFLAEIISEKLSEIISENLRKLFQTFPSKKIRKLPEQNIGKSQTSS
jgi:hypothetical protein